jgi:hypothetical protein
LHVLTDAAGNKSTLVFARDIKIDRQRLTLDQISKCSDWFGLLCFGVSTALVKVKRLVPNLWLAKQKQKAIFAIFIMVTK